MIRLAPSIIETLSSAAPILCFAIRLTGKTSLYEHTRDSNQVCLNVDRKPSPVNPRSHVFCGYSYPGRRHCAGRVGCSWRVLSLVQSYSEFAPRGSASFLGCLSICG